MEAQQRLNFSQKRKEVQQWLRAMVNAEPLFRAVEPAVVHSLAMRCKFRAYPRGVACVLEDTRPGAALFMIRKGAVEGKYRRGGMMTALTVRRVAARHTRGLSRARRHIQHQGAPLPPPRCGVVLTPHRG